MKKWMLSLVAVGAILSLSACGGSKNTASNSETSKTSKSNSEPTYKIGEDLMKNERIIYKLDIDSEDSAGINTPVKYVYYFNKGKVTTYEAEDVVLGDFKGLNNKKIIDKLVEALKKQDNKKVPQTGAAIAKGQMTKYVAGTPQSIKISAVTDSTGNNIKTEVITASAKANFGLQIDSVPIVNAEDGTPITNDNDKPDYSAPVLPHDKENDLKLTLNELSGAKFTAYDRQYLILDNAEDQHYYYATEFNGTSMPVFDSVDDNHLTISTSK